MNPDLLHLNDQLGTFPPSYYAASCSEPAPDRPQLTGTLDAEIAIIGGGFTGLSAALHLAAQGKDVAVLDAHRMGWGASGRNGGQVATGLNQDPWQLEPQLGHAKTQTLVDLVLSGPDLIQTLAQQHAIDAQYKPGLLYPNHRRRFDAGSAEQVRRLNQEYGHTRIRYLPPEELPSLLTARGYSGATLDTAGGHIHPLNFALGLARAAETAGARLFDRSQVLHTERKGDTHHLTTAQGELRAHTLIYAGNGYLGGLEPKTAARVMPINSFIVATEPLGEARATELIRDQLAVADSRFVVRYYRLSQDWRLLFGGRESYSYRFHDDLKRFAVVPMLDTFPQLQGVKIDYGWGGTLGISRTRLPVLRQLDTQTFSLSGYSGSGVAMATLAGKLVADKLAGQDEGFDLLASLPAQPFPGGLALRSALLFGAMNWFALRDRL